MIKNILRHIKNFNYTKALVSKAKWQKIEATRNKKLIEDWQNGQLNSPPHIVKQSAIKAYQEKYQCNFFVETGTYLGEMVEAQKDNFKQIFSIELSEALYKKAQKKFKQFPHITILQGDSGKVLPQVLHKIDSPALFWLDGHYSAGITAKGEKECPIFEEIDAIFNSNAHNHIILVDDARCFNGKGDYPTIEALTSYVQQKNNRYHLEVKDDIIRYTVSA